MGSTTKLSGLYWYLFKWDETRIRAYLLLTGSRMLWVYVLILDFSSCDVYMWIRTLPTIMSLALLVYINIYRYTRMVNWKKLRAWVLRLIFQAIGNTNEWPRFTSWAWTRLGGCINAITIVLTIYLTRSWIVRARASSTRSLDDNWESYRYT